MESTHYAYVYFKCEKCKKVWAIDHRVIGGNYVEVEGVAVNSPFYFNKLHINYNRDRNIRYRSCVISDEEYRLQQLLG